MATISEHKTPKGSIYFKAQVRIKGKKPLSKSFKTEAEATQWAYTTEAEIRAYTGDLDTEAPKKWTVAQVIDWYLQNPNPDRQLSTKKHYQRLNLLKEELGQFSVDTINPKFLTKWIDKRRTQLGNSDATIYHYFVALKNAMVWHSIQHNYKLDLFNIIKFSSKPKSRDRIFTKEEQKEVFKAILKRAKANKKELILIIRFALETSIRIGELLQIQYKNVNLKDRYVDIEQHTTKTRTFRRMPLTTKAKYILQWFFKYHNKNKQPDLRVFNMYHTNEHHLSRQFQIVCGWAGVKNIRFHDLRHTALTNFYTEYDNLTDIEVAQISGHKTLQMLKRYSHLRPHSIVAKLK